MNSHESVAKDYKKGSRSIPPIAVAYQLCEGVMNKLILHYNTGKPGGRVQITGARNRKVQPKKNSLAPLYPVVPIFFFSVMMECKLRSILNQYDHII